MMPIRTTAQHILKLRSAAALRAAQKRQFSHVSGSSEPSLLQRLVACSKQEKLHLRRSLYGAAGIPRAKARAELESEVEAHKVKVEDIRKAAEEAAHRAEEGAAAAAEQNSSNIAPLGNEAFKEQIEAAIQRLQTGLIERDTEARLLLLAALSCEHILFIGPPGTAKSELGRRLSQLADGPFFERLLTRFSVPEELFGPLSMRALQDDQYVRQTTGYLPEASVAFIDEIFKANSAILNTLLTILNERMFDNGSRRLPVPLVCLVGASNELPESEELDALYDRFLIRRKVQQVSASRLPELLTVSEESANVAGTAPDALQLPSTLGHLKTGFSSLRSEALQHVALPDTVQQLLVDVRTYLQEKCEPPVYVSDRRLLKAVNLMKVAAYADGRASVSLHDCLLLQHMLWQKPDESGRVADFVLSQLASDEKSLAQADYIFKGIFARACQVTSTKGPTEELLGEVQEMRKMLVGRLTGVYRSLKNQSPAPARSLWTSEEEAEAIDAAVAPKLAQAQDEVKRLLYEVVTLEAVLSLGTLTAYNIAMVLPQRWENYMKQSN